MFRQMRRFKQQISEDECKEVLKNEPRGVLALMGDDGYPYAIPLSHWYSEKDNKLYFHCAKEGKKLDSINASINKAGTDHLLSAHDSTQL